MSTVNTCGCFQHFFRPPAAHTVPAVLRPHLKALPSRTQHSHLEELQLLLRTPEEGVHKDHGGRGALLGLATDH